MPRRREEREAEQRRQQRHARATLIALARTPDAVIDVGVHRGTPWLYEAFAGVPFVLVDPQESADAELASKPDDYVFVNKALGRAPGRLTLSEQGPMSTFMTRTPLTRVPTKRQYEVEVTTLDAVIAEHLPWARRIGLKIDTEGFELEVLGGLAAHLDRIDFVVSEASVLNRFEGSYNFSELVCAFWEKGFRFYNLLNETRRRPPRVYDCIFLRANDPAFDGGRAGTR